MTPVSTVTTPYIRPGLYPALRIKNCEILEPSGTRRHAIHVLELEVVKSEVVEHRTGQTVAWLMRAGFSLQAFLAEVLRMPIVEVTNTTVATVFDGNNLLRGMLLRCEARERKTKNGRTFVYCKWTPIKEVQS